MTEGVWARRISCGEVPEEGLRVKISADLAVRSALAQAAGLRDLSRLDARFDLTRKGSNRLHVEGEVSADVVQSCVVTLDAVENTVLEPVDVTFAGDPAGSLGNDDGEASFGLTDAEPPEPLTGGAVDLGAIATEYFLLGLDPYPRKEGAVFESPDRGMPAANPFAALVALKKRPPEGGGA